MSGTPRRNRPGPWLALVLIALFLSACGDDDRYAYDLVVPLGTGERMAAGEEVDLMPATLRFQVGDRIRVSNEDVVDHSAGPYLVGAGQEFELTYGSAGRYEGICPISKGGRYVLIVTD